MPHRLASVAILVAWALAAGALVRRDVLPDLLIGPPPDLRTVSRAEEQEGPTRWAVQVAGSHDHAEEIRTVGFVQTESVRKPDGWVTFNSKAEIDSAGLMMGTIFDSGASGGREDRLDVLSSIDIDPAGNLFHFYSAVRPWGRREDLMILEGSLRENAIAVRARSPILPMLKLLNWRRSFPYQARGMVQNPLGPTGRMPGLHVGQRWESQIVSPLTGQVEAVRVEVVRRHLIYWNGGSVTTLEVVSRLPTLSARTWVRPDGLVLRQEVPTPFLNLYLERLVGEGVPAAPAAASPAR